MQKKRFVTLVVSYCVVAVGAVVLWPWAARIPAIWRLPAPPEIEAATAPHNVERSFLEPKATSTTDNLEEVIGALERGEFVRAYLVNAVGIETIVRATPEACVGFAPDKIEYWVTPSRRRRLISLLRELQANSRPDNSGADVRVGLILSAEPFGKMRWSVFTDQLGQYGYMGGHSVKTKGALATFVKRALANLE